MAATDLPTVQLSFDTRPGGAWDDRELIKASEAAMKEFHVHHPGPGSWLDKATAALAAGRALPGADAYGTEWYDASLPVAESSAQAQQPQQTPVSKKQRTKGKRAGAVADQAIGVGAVDVPNPYAGPVKRSEKRAASPSYQPPSPGAGSFADAVGAEDAEEEEDYDEEAEWGEADWQVEDYYPDHEDDPAGEDEDEGGHNHPMDASYGGYGPGLPGVGVQPAQHVSREEAIGYAMSAQYWAGYWMGVAQARAQAPQPTAPATMAVQAGPSRPQRKRRREDVEPITAVANEEELLNRQDVTNLFVTQKHFDRPAITGLRR
ncbi:hypothetical protein IAU60_003115 [Kwoniella sp. DSM 27419]